MSHPIKTITILIFITLAIPLHAEIPQGPQDCSPDMEYWDYSQGMCEPYPIEDMKMLMVHGNGFAAGIHEQGPRAKNRIAGPNMFMIDAGTAISDRQYLNLDFMGTLEKWTYPYVGYPELMQIGESHSDGTPFLDAQHPHSSPIMGLTLSDTIVIGENKDFIKIFFAPRGESTDGPVAFMHRVTGMVNPDAPLGHHIGQDVGHVSSTVTGAMLRLNKITLEASAFHGLEPEPTKVDLPMGSLNSYAFRVTEAFSQEFFMMASWAHVQGGEPNAPEAHSSRLSASAYYQHKLRNDWKFFDTLVWGHITNYDGSVFLNSFLDEFLFQKNRCSFWSRLEVLQRTPGELEIASNDLNRGRWVTAATLGYTHKLYSWNDDIDLGLGGSITKDFLPAAYRSTYGNNPLEGKIFLQLSGMKMQMD